MAYTTINDPSAHFQTQLYTGNGGSQDITNGGNSSLQPDWLWIKQRSSDGNVSSHVVKDSSRGVTKEVYPNANTTEGTSSLIDGFLSDGFSINNTANEHYNYDGGLYVSYQWKANAGTRTTFTESGNNPAGGHQANPTAGFSIVDYTGTGAQGTIAHGLGVAPVSVFTKGRDDGHSWIVGHTAMGADFENVLLLDTADAKSDDANSFADVAPTSSVFTVNSAGGTNQDGEKYIAYCFAPIKGYSHFGDYKGNSASNGAFIYTGFKPAWILIKAHSDTKNWHLNDSKRIDVNGRIRGLRANTTDDENTGSEYGPIDFLSNGFKIRTSDNQINGDGSAGNYLFWAFAESPFVSSTGTPTTAR